MSDGTRLPPARTAPPEARNRVARERTQPPAEPLIARRDDVSNDTRKKPSPHMGEAIVKAGAGGENNITIDMFWVEVDGNLPAAFTVTTRPNHDLEVVMEQQSYRKTYTGTGSLKTGLAPIAPIGTTGSVTATDRTTGETMEQPWTWQPRGGSTGLWQIIKRLLGKGD